MIVGSIALSRDTKYGDNNYIVPQEISYSLVGNNYRPIESYYLGLDTKVVKPFSFWYIHFYETNNTMMLAMRQFEKTGPTLKLRPGIWKTDDGINWRLKIMDYDDIAFTEVKILKTKNNKAEKLYFEYIESGPAYVRTDAIPNTTQAATTSYSVMERFVL